MKKLADVYGARSYLIVNGRDDGNKVYSSSWVVVTKNQAVGAKIEYLSTPDQGKRGGVDR